MRRRTSAEWHQLFAEFETSGETAAGFCLLKGMDHNKEGCVLGPTERNPAFLIVAAVLLIINRNRMRILEQRRVLLEADAVLVAAA